MAFETQSVNCNIFSKNLGQDDFDTVFHDIGFLNGKIFSFREADSDSIDDFT